MMASLIGSGRSRSLEEDRAVAAVVDPMTNALLGVSRLDGKEDDIRRFLELGVSKTAIAKITGVSRTTAS